MATDADTDTAAKITVLKHLANGKTFDFVATVTRLTEEHVRDIATMHGYPKPESMKRAAAILEQNLNAASDLTTKTPVVTEPSRRISRPPAPSRAPARASAPPPARSAPPAAASTSRAKLDDIHALLDAAKASDSKQVQKLAGRILEDIARLRDLLDEEQQAAEQRRQAEAERAAALAEVERLEEQLRVAKAKLAGKPPAERTRTPKGSTATDGRTETLDQTRAHIADVLHRHGITSRDVRAWASENSIDCPTTGMLPLRVVDAYAAAHTDNAA